MRKVIYLGAMKNVFLFCAAAVFVVGCTSSALDPDGSLWPRVDIGGRQYLAISTDPAGKGFDTLKVYSLAAFTPPVLVGSITLPDPHLYSEQSITIDPSLGASTVNPAVTGSVLTVRKWNAEPLDTWKADPAFTFPTANALYEFDVSDPANPLFVGWAFF
jgi:hypothetical protein